MKPNAVHLTAEEYEKLEEELHRLKTKERPAIIKSIAAAREHGDLKENAEYHAAKEKQVLLENKILRLEDVQARVIIIDPAESHSSTVQVGSKVTIVNIKTEEKMTYVLAGTLEMDFHDMIEISMESPVGKKIIGKSVGDIIEIEIPGGKLEYKILEIF